MFKTYYFERVTHRLRYPYHLLVTTSPRKILFGINLLLCVCSLVIAGFALFLCSILYNPGFTEGWITWFGMAFVGLILAAVSIVGMRGAHLISFDLLLVYFWLIALFIVPFILSLFSCFNYNLYTEIWFKHSWDLTNFEQVRQIFCPEHTADTRCIVPPAVNSSSNAAYTSWCLTTFNQTDCQQIRNDAISNAVNWGFTIILTQSFIGVVGLLVIGYSIYICHLLITVNVITQMMMDVINYFLILPMAGCIALTIYFWWVQDLDIEANWFPKLYLALAIVQVVVLPLGIVSGKSKSRLLLWVYIALMFLVAFGFAASAGVQWTLAGFVVSAFKPSQDVIYDYACRKSLPGCSGCNLNPRTCSEWSNTDILTLFSLNLRLSGMVSTASILYIIGGLIVAFLVDNSLKHYKSDYI